MAAASAKLLQKWFPHITAPLICNAPMFGTAGGALAAAVSRAGGLGFIGAGFKFTPDSPQPANLEAELTTARKALALAESETLPLGVGFISVMPSGFFDSVGPLLTRHRPAAVWLFAPTQGADHEPLIKGIKELGTAWNIRVFVQVGSVSAAREAASQGADVIVAQGSDAGGHQFAATAGVVSLVPEVVDMIHKEFSSQREVAVVAAGGIADGRGVAAALCLGAGGIVMGTRFICAAEANSNDNQRRQVVAATDGGTITIKSTVHDDIQGTPIWPALYDGRAIRGESWADHEKGMALEENKRLFAEASEKGAVNRRIVWAGTAVGLVEEVSPAGDIVKKARDQTKAALGEVKELS